MFKPNLVEFEPESSIIESPCWLHRALEGFARGRVHVGIAEGQGPFGRKHSRGPGGCRRLLQDKFPTFEDLFPRPNLGQFTGIRHTRQWFAPREVSTLPTRAFSDDLMVRGQNEGRTNWTEATLSIERKPLRHGSGRGRNSYGWAPRNVLHWAGIRGMSLHDLHYACPPANSRLSILGIVGWNAKKGNPGVPNGIRHSWWPRPIQ